MWILEGYGCVGLDLTRGILLYGRYGVWYGTVWLAAASRRETEQFLFIERVRRVGGVVGT